jgi:superoxide dismutase, Fe-Mn family
MMTQYSLPALPYAVDALEPWCSAETLQLHHGKHHAAYVAAANADVEALAAVDPDDAYALAGAQASLAFNVGGHVLHSLLWENLSPEKTEPTGAFRRQIETDLGSVERMNTLLSAACKGVHGSGWGALVFDSTSRRIHVARLHDHQSDLIANSSLLAVIDVWEHAYYLSYRSDRPGWIKAVVEHLDWGVIASRCKQASAANSQAQ